MRKRENDLAKKRHKSKAFIDNVRELSKKEGTRYCKLRQTATVDIRLPRTID